jgi:hypothetical protein
MRTYVQKVSLLTLAAVAAGLSLTACDLNGASASSRSSATTAAPGSSDGSDAGAAAGSGTSANQPAGAAGSGSGVADAGICHTVNLAFSHSWGMAEGEVLINMRNTGSDSCAMHGFPGVDLKGRDGSVSAARSSMPAPNVVLRPGQKTNFVLHFPPNNSGGSGVTFTKLVVTPPNETHSHTMSVGINIPADSNSSPTITVDPVGAGK